MEFRDNGGPENGCEGIITKGPNCYYKIQQLYCKMEQVLQTEYFITK